MNINFFSESSYPTVPLRRILVANDGGAWGEDSTGEDDTLVLRSTEQTFDGKWDITDPAPRQLSSAEKRSTKLIAGDLLMTKSSGSRLHLGKTTLVDHEVETLHASYSNFMQRLRFSHEDNPRFYWYVFQSYPFRENINFLSTTSTGLVNLTASTIGSFIVPRPPLEEQNRIVETLDYELAEIDGLIADQLHLQELLSERWTSLTFELATDASNPDRYETGHPFWKTLPKGWTLQKLGWHFKIGNGSTPKSDNPEYWTDNADNGFPWFNSSVVNNEVAGTPSRYVTTKALNECHLPFVPQGSLLVGLTGQGKTRGMVTKTGIDSTINQHVAYLHAYKTSVLNIDFVKLCLQATYPMLRFISDGNGSTKGALTCDSLNHLSLPVPPVNHQRKSINLFKNQQITNNSLMKSSAEFIKILEEVKKSKN